MIWVSSSRRGRHEESFENLSKSSRDAPDREMLDALEVMRPLLLQSAGGWAVRRLVGLEQPVNAELMDCLKRLSRC